MFVFSTRLRVVIRRYFYENEFVQNPTTHRTLMYILFLGKEQKLDSGLIRFTNVYPLLSRLLKLKQYKSDIYPQRIVVFKSGAKVVKRFGTFTG